MNYINYQIRLSMLISLGDILLEDRRSERIRKSNLLDIEPYSHYTSRASKLIGYLNTKARSYVPEITVK
jgi:hypothetical protein